MANVVKWDQYKYSFEYDYQNTIQEMIDLYVSTKKSVYFSQYTTFTTGEIADFIKALPGDAEDNDLYVEFAKFVYDRKSYGTGTTDDDKWKNYLASFSEEFKPGLNKMIGELRGAPSNMSWSTYAAGDYTIILDHFNAQAATRIQIFEEFAKLLVKKRKEIENPWVVVESSFSEDSDEQNAYAEFSYYLQTCEPFTKFQYLQKASPEYLATFLRSFMKYSSNPRTYANFIANDIREKAYFIDSKGYTDAVAEDNFINLFRSEIRRGMRAFLNTLKSKNIIHTISDLKNIPALTGISDTPVCVGGDTELGHELLLNGDFSMTSGSWYNSSYQLLTNLSGDSGKNIFPYTDYLIQNEKRYKVSLNVLDISGGAVVKDQSNNIIFTATTTGRKEFFYDSISGSTRLKFEISLFDNVSIKEVITSVSCDPVAIDQQASPDHYQLSTITPQGTVNAGDIYMVRINNGFPIIAQAEAATVESLTDAITDAINEANANGIGDWLMVTASDETTYVAVTAEADNAPFSLEVISIKKELLSLPADHLLFKVIAQDILNRTEAAANQAAFMTFNFNGLLINSNDGKPLPNYQVRATLLDNNEVIGKQTAASNGFFTFAYNVPKPFVPYSNVQIEVFEGTTIITTTTFSMQNGTEAIKTVNCNPTVSTVTYPAISLVASLTGLTIPSTLSTFLSSNEIVTLKDIRDRGGLKYIIGLPVSQTDAAVVALDAHADLNTLSFDIMANQHMINNGYKSVYDLGMASRTEIVGKYMGSSSKIGGFNAMRIQAISKSYASFLQNQIVAHRASSGISSTLGKIPELDAVLEEQCFCDDCNAAVSPLAYLTDLINYTTKNVNTTYENVFQFLEDNFFQNFEELPASCDDVEAKVCQQRVVVEILRRYLGKAPHIPSSPKQTILDKAVLEYCVNAYRYLLIQLGTSYEELRQVRTGANSADKKAALAKRLRIPYNESFDPFASLFIDIKSSNITEAALEKLFGLVDTSRNHTCYGLKLSDTENQVSRWHFNGIKWNVNTDENGFIYAVVDQSIPQVKLYKKTTRLSGELIAIAEEVSTDHFVISPENESGLSGEFTIKDAEDNDTVYFSVVPMITSWKLQYLRSSWSEQDLTSNAYRDHTIPVIEPDIIGPDDFRKPVLTNEIFELWASRRDFIDVLLESLRASGTNIPSILELMDNEVDYAKYDATEVTRQAWASVPSFNTFTNTYNNLKNGNEADYEVAYETVTEDWRMTVPAFYRFYELYAATKVNDEKGFVGENVQAAGVSQKQVIHITPVGVKKGDRFELTLVGNTTVSYTALATDTIKEVVTGLKLLISWPGISVTDDNQQYLILEATAVNTPFTLLSKVFRAPASAEMDEIYSILAQSIKKSFYQDWIDEENLEELGIHINSADFWNSIKEPVVGTWPVLPVAGVPMVDPELVNIDMLAEPTAGSDAIAIWYDRRDELDAAYASIKETKENDGIEEAFKEAWGNSYLEDYSSLEQVQSDLNNILEPELAIEAASYIESVLYCTVEDFGKIMDVVNKNIANSGVEITKDEWATLYQILTTAFKKRVKYNIWTDEELTFNYIMTYKAALPLWRASLDDRRLWTKSLELVKSRPVVDPDIIRPDFIKSLDTDMPAITLWNNRNDLLNTLFNTIKSDRELNSSPTALAGFDFIIEKYVSGSGSALLETLNEQNNQGEDISGQLSQLNLTIEALIFLLDIRNLAATAPTSILSDEWKEVYSILLQVDKERTYSLWSSQELEAGIANSPDHFVLSPYKDEDYSGEDRMHQVRWRYSEKARKEWINTLQARVTQEQDIYNTANEIVEKAEEEWMTSLRDALVMATDVSGTKLEEKAKNISDRLLVDAENNCCQKTTRVAQAIETLQGLFFSIRTGIIQDTYPSLTLRILSDRFDEEWIWMGSYATWRAAMFVNIYPENLLYPTFRGHQTSGFQTFSDAIRNDLRLTPAKAAKMASDYYTYYEDVSKLTLVASCSGRTISFNGNYQASGGMGQYKNLQYLFAKGGKSERYYWSTMDVDSVNEYAHSSWAPLEALDRVNVSNVMGATAWKKSSNEQFLLFFFVFDKDGVKKIGYVKLNLDNGNWDTDVTELDIPTDQGTYRGAVLNIENEIAAPTDIYVAVHLGDKIYTYKMNPKGNDLVEDKSGDFEIDYGSAEENTNRKYVNALYSFINKKLIYKTSSFTSVEPVKKITDVSFNVSVFNADSKQWQVLSSSSIGGEILTKVNELKAKLANNIEIPKFGMLHQLIKYDCDYKVEIVRYEKSNETSVIRFGKQKQIFDSKEFNDYRSAFIWPDNDLNTGNNGYYLLYKYDNTSQVYFKHFTSAGDPVNNVRYAFMNDLKFATTYTNSSGKVFLLYQQASTGSAICSVQLIKNNASGVVQIDSREVVYKYNPIVGGPFRLSPAKIPGAASSYKTVIQTNYNNNKQVQRSEFEYIQEAYYFVPMLTALTLQDRGYYTEALDWFRVVYDYSIPVKSVGTNIRPRKIWYGLIEEETRGDDYKRIDNWLSDPLNPHAIAETRQNLYTRYTVLSIVRCMQAFADSEYTKDSPESVPLARQMYEESIELLKEESLVSQEASCEVTIDSLEYEPTDEPEWPEWKAVWLGIKNDLAKLKEKSIITNVIGLISAELASVHELPEKMSVCRDIVDDALLNPDMFVNVASIITDNLLLTKDATTRLMKDANMNAIAADMAYKLSAAFLNSVSLVTGLPEETLERPDFYLNWFETEQPIVTPQAAPNTYTNVTAQYPVRITAKDRVYYNYVAPSQEQILTLTLINNPIKVVNQYYDKSSFYVPSPNISFCIPPNPVLNGLILQAELNLFKIRNCMNIAGMIRELDPYAAPTDQTTGLPQVGGDGTLNLNISKSFSPSQYRFEILMDRAKQQVQIAQQLESTLLSLYEKSDAEHYNLLKARQDLGLAKAGVKLQDLRLKVADSSVTLAQIQKDRVNIQLNYYKGLISQGLLGTETLALAALRTSVILQQASAAIYIAAGVASMIKMSQGGIQTDFGAPIQGIAQSISAISSSFGTVAQIQSTLASYERRQQEWQFQVTLGNQDLKIGDQQIRIANQQKDVVTQERQISQLQLDNAEATIDFLQNKFTNAELYDWMTRILSRVYSYYLQQAISTAQVAMNQLAFERQDNIPSFIKNDYWEAPSEAGSLSLTGGDGVDRRGLTASSRLLQDISKLDQYAFDSDKRKLQMTKVISLAALDPIAFQDFRQTGVLYFSTPEKMFDKDFPGHYLRVVKRIKTSVIALIPPVEGIKATLSNVGLSYSVTKNSTLFQRTSIKRDPESVVLTSPIDATGVFELNQVSTKLNPFESIGVDSRWEFVMSKAANYFDYSTIADILFTIEYTALDDFDHRRKVLKEMDPTIEAVRPYNFTTQFADQWYDFNNPVSNNAPVTVAFETRKADFPANLENMLIQKVTLYMVPANAEEKLNIENKDIPLSFDNISPTLSVGADNLINSTDFNASKNIQGTWVMTLPKEVITKIREKKITDILFAITYKADLPKWPL